MFKVTGAISRLLFLTILLVGNVIGFHYYFTPVANSNLKYIPANANLVMTINLKSISGTLFNELVFRPESFEKDVISESEQELFGKNQSLGINPFGLVSVFRFDFKDKVLNGASLNLEDSDKFQEEFKKRNYQLEQIDDVKVFSNGEITAFLFNKVVVFVFAPLDLDEQENLACNVLLNENPINADLLKGHFTLFAKKGLLANTPVAPFFRLLPDYAESFFVSGVFEKGSIDLSGRIQVSNQDELKKSFDLADPKIEKHGSMEFGFSGNEFSPSIQSFLKQKFVDSKDTNLNTTAVLQNKFNGLHLSMNEVVLPIDLNIINAIMGGGVLPQPEYKIKINLNSNEVEKAFVNYEFPLSLIENNDLKRKVFAKITDENRKDNSAYLYFNPVRFIDEADMNIIVKSLIDPFLIFDELQLSATRYEAGELYFNGNFSLIEKEIHSMVQMRLLFKDISSIL